MTKEKCGVGLLCLGMVGGFSCQRWRQTPRFQSLWKPGELMVGTNDMALTADHVTVITELILTEPTLPEVAAKWRNCYPDVRVMLISELEMRYEKPVVEFAGRRVYFALATGVCISITAEQVEATC